MAKHVGETFVSRRIVLDDNIYQSCAFKKCAIVYMGGEKIILNGCSFDECRFELEGAAGRTLGFLHILYHNAGDAGTAIIEDAFAAIRRPEPRLEATPRIDPIN